MDIKLDQSSTLLQSASRNQSGKNPEDIRDLILMYLRNGFWLVLAGTVIYFSNFFHHLFRNPNINELFFQISMTGYTVTVLLILYSAFILPTFYGIQSLEQYNPKLIPVGAVVGVISVISLLIAIWPVWGFTSFLIFISLWKGFFSLSVFLPGGKVGELLFVLINTSVVLSFYIIEHEGYFH